MGAENRLIEIEIYFQLGYNPNSQMPPKGKDKQEGTRTMTLKELPIGVDGRVISVHGSGTATRRLMEMGLIPGVTVKVVKAAPFGDPLEVRVRGYSLALRKNEAAAVEITL
jgi:ferrous iron transport protein A